MRSSRFFSWVSGGWPVVLSSAMTYLPSSLRALAASAAAAICSCDKPSSCLTSSTTTAAAFTSASTFWLKVVPRLASSAFMALSVVLSASESLAPSRTKSL
ncbi:hypothetical protein XAUB_26480 [Xanthomonas citri pv. aurantifolii str. ICPB 11122]|nr:hypothetical protein XAUB_26480 [Xanthomonas citri pv. aurantifolii str. ICPB 11122]